MGSYRPFSMKFGTQTRDRHAEFKSHKTEVCGKKLQKLNVKNNIVLKRQRCMSAKLQKSRIFLFAGRSSHTHTKDD
jgi:hypothetical protein